jgi:hypothetical protein
MGNFTTKLEDMLVHSGTEVYRARVAAAVHDEWCASQPRQPDGTRVPRLKHVASSTGQAVEVDIANTNFDGLPQKWKETNLKAAGVIVSEILRHVKAPERQDNGGSFGRQQKHLDVDFIEMAAHFTHQQWILEHQYASNTSELIPYYLLPQASKNLLRRFVRQAIALYDPVRDRMDTQLFPPREHVVVPLPPLGEHH